MPAYRGKVSEREARDLVAQVRGPDPEPAARQGDTRPDRFERRFRELQEELEDLRRQFREASNTPRNP